MKLLAEEVKVKSLSCVRLFGTPWAVPGFSVHRIFQARVPEWVAISFSRGSSLHKLNPGLPHLQAAALPSEPPGKPYLRKIFT